MHFITVHLSGFTLRLAMKREPYFILEDLERALELPVNTRDEVWPLARINLWLADQQDRYPDPEVFAYFIDRLSFEVYRQISGGLISEAWFDLTHSFNHFYAGIEQRGLDSELPPDEILIHLSELIADQVPCSEFSILGYIDGRSATATEKARLVSAIMMVSHALEKEYADPLERLEDIPGEVQEGLYQVWSQYGLD